MPLVLRICVLFISLMQSVNGAQFLNTTSVPLVFAAGAAAMFGTVKVPLTSTYTSL